MKNVETTISAFQNMVLTKGPSARGRFPNLIIAGFVKAGTTSLFTYLSMHPEVCASRIKETNYFIPLTHGKELPHEDLYLDFFRHCRGEKYVMESSPRYIVGGTKIARAIIDRCGHSKIIVVLRNPVERLFSFYRHARKSLAIPGHMSFEEYVQKCLEESADSTDDAPARLGNIYGLSIEEGCYAKYIKQWRHVFSDSIKICFFDHLESDAFSFMRDICRWLDIDPGIYSSYSFDVENRSFMFKNRMLHKLALSVNRNFEGKNRLIKKIIRRFYFIINEDSSRNKEAISQKTYASLENYYQMPNRRLHEMLSETGHRDMPAWLTPLAG